MIARRQIGDTLKYHGRRIRALFMGPDLLSVVDDIELPDFFLNVEAAQVAGKKYVDEELKVRGLQS